MATQAEIAAHLDLSQPTIAKLISQGILPDAERGALNLETCRVAYIRHLRDMAAGRVTDGDLTAQRTRLAKEQADKIEMANAQRRKEMLEIAPIVAVFAEQCASLRTRLLALPTSIAPAVHRCKGVDQARDVIETAVFEALEAICADASAVEAIVTKTAISDPGDAKDDEDALDDDGMGTERGSSRRRGTSTPAAAQGAGNRPARRRGRPGGG